MAGILQNRLNASRDTEEELTISSVPDEYEDETPSDTLKKRLLRKKTDETELEPEESPEEKRDSYLTHEDMEELQRIENMMSEENFVVERKRRKMLQRITTCVLTTACVYLIILIYGSIITEFTYDDSGQIAPVTMTVTDISNKNEYNELVGMYIQARSLYETLLTLDYRMAAGEEDTMVIAPEYEEALDIVSTLTTTIDAAVISSKYTQVKNLLLTWVQTHAAAYCQYMSAAVTQNNSDAAAEAIAAREVLNSQFQLISQNIVTLGEDIKGYDLTDLTSWSPDGFIQESIEGIDSTDTSYAAQDGAMSETSAITEDYAPETQAETETNAAIPSEFSLSQE